MKIRACTDGSEQSQIALEKALIIAGGCDVNEIVIIHIDDEKNRYFVMLVGESHVPNGN